MLYQLLKDGFAAGKDLNCAEQILYGANEAYNLGLDKKALKQAAPFGGGMGIEDKCGALTGGLMVLSQLYVDDRGHASDIKRLSQELFDRYGKQMKSIDCKPLKDLHKTEEYGCREVILEAAKILDDVIAEENAK